MMIISLEYPACLRHVPLLISYALPHYLAQNSLRLRIWKNKSMQDFLSTPIKNTAVYSRSWKLEGRAALSRSSSPLLERSFLLKKDLVLVVKSSLFHHPARPIGEPCVLCATHSETQMKQSS